MNVTLENIVTTSILVRGGQTHGHIIIIADSTTYQSLFLRAAVAVVPEAVVAIRAAGVGVVKALARGGVE